MDSFNFHDIRVEKANAISRYRRVQRITILFRFVELFIFLIILSRVSTQFSTFSFNLSADCFKGIFAKIFSQKFVFLIGNAIVIALFLISGGFNSAKNGEKSTDFYDEYVQKCRKIEQFRSKEEKIESIRDEKKMKRSKSENFVRAEHGEERRRDLRRSMTEKYRKSVKKTAPAAAPEDEMSGEEFRRTVEAFIARQQRCLREEEEDEFCSAVVSI
ncbi:hypothetical protein BUALT_Bualt15G0022200 [Buddleja alternifolia]|uniref:Transmembrane protein n=1 Tax=Buddleja alternifolia TaxID=168488 RepID=A0AAV6WIH6_9LAMI|nr:hypothetical protein BUALT_Bualt15G0022200 [Buddleja alternifolia]